MNSAVADFTWLGIISLAGMLFLIIIIIAAIILMVVASKKTKSRKIAISAECAKIDQMQAEGKVSQLEAEELKRAVGYVPVTSENVAPDIHIKLVGYFHLAMFLIIPVILTAIVVPYYARALHEPAFGVHVAPLPVLVLPFIIFCGLIIAAIALLKLKNWARYIIIVLALLEMWNFPLGTALGLYSLWVLLIRDGAAEYFTGNTQ